MVNVSTSTQSNSSAAERAAYQRLIAARRADRKAEQEADFSKNDAATQAEIEYETERHNRWSVANLNNIKPMSGSSFSSRADKPTTNTSNQEPTTQDDKDMTDNSRLLIHNQSISSAKRRQAIQRQAQMASDNDDKQRRAQENKKKEEEQMRLFVRPAQEMVLQSANLLSETVVAPLFVWPMWLATKMLEIRKTITGEGIGIAFIDRFIIPWDTKDLAMFFISATAVFLSGCLILGIISFFGYLAFNLDEAAMIAPALSGIITSIMSAI